MADGNHVFLAVGIDVLVVIEILAFREATKSYSCIQLNPVARTLLLQEIRCLQPGAKHCYIFFAVKKLEPGVRQ